jgi:hypothetical protein
VGTSGSPIILESVTAAAGQAGDWLGVYLRSETLSGTEFGFVTLRHAGEDNFGVLGCLTIDGTSTNRVSIHDSVFSDCGLSAVGVTENGFEFNSFANNTIADSTVGFRLQPSAIGQIGDDTVFTAVTENIITGSNVETTATWAGLPVPWRVVGSLEVGGDANPVLTLSAGVVLRFATGQWIQVGSNPGRLLAAGSIADPVVFESSQAGASPGSWLGVVFRSNTLNNSSLDHVIVRHGGEENFGLNAGVTLDNTATAVSITNSTFEQNLNADIFVGCISTIGGNTGNVTPTGVIVQPGC